MRFTLAILHDGRAVAFGGNDYCQLGRPQSAQVADQVLLPANSSGASTQATGHVGSSDAEGFLPESLQQTGVVAVDAGLHCGFVVGKDGSVYACGHKGHGLTEPGNTPAEIDYWTKTEALTHISALKVPVVSVAAEYEAAFALTESGDVFEWGKQSGGSCGWGFESSSAAVFVEPQVRSDVHGVSAIVNYGDTCLALVPDDSSSSSVWAFRLGQPAQLVAGSAGVEAISYSLALRNGRVLELKVENSERSYIESERLVPAVSERVVLIGAGRCGKEVIVTEPLTSTDIDGADGEDT
eukprot:TRINITY_DN20998_c0_g1_i1.p2 TRINITY_DN20998_c0_g1~~TRINITY_DN20998_c0_g1_i1.p2  ORF type:complete len:296 (-),score=66.95 TRINITY_DN20998_c0_g1_i1:72-959(-)